MHGLIRYAFLLLFLPVACSPGTTYSVPPVFYDLIEKIYAGETLISELPPLQWQEIDQSAEEPPSPPVDTILLPANLPAVLRESGLPDIADSLVPNHLISVPWGEARLHPARVGNPLLSWADLRERLRESGPVKTYEQVGRFIRLSQPIVSDDETHILVVEERFSGPDAGEGTLCIFQQSAGTWILRYRKSLWIN